VLATIRTAAGLASVRQLLVAHRYWRIKGIRSDLVILNTKTHSYAQELQDQLMTIAMSSGEGGVLERPGGLFVRRAELLSSDDTALLRTTARIHVLCDGVGLGEIVAANLLSYAERSAKTPSAGAKPAIKSAPVQIQPSPDPSVHPNGYGARTEANDFPIDVAGARVPP